MGLDINTATRVQFANFFKLSMSDELKKYQEQTNVINTKILTTKQLNIGGEPQKGGSWEDWERSVRDNLAPMSYDLVSITSLFNYV